MSVTQRLAHELQQARRETANPSIAAKNNLISLGIANESSLFIWKAIILGPQDTPFAGAQFNITIKIPPDYPMAPPVASFDPKKVFHPNINYNTGEICLDILKTRWSPSWALLSVCWAIVNLLTEPEASSPLNCDAGNLCRSGDEVAYYSIARMISIRRGGAENDLSW